ncbi:Legionaminic acid biosynthesis protein PtmF [hydrothermal vent metagenome]|uniref:Legionaminic acid biosynthesis protein PtmF n=1 Tax=hydrothermal vent metagenome TaxID=652676 RepID=A0A1W1CRW1_9ZZZZ
MKALLIGYGSIGKRHDEVLSNFSEIASIDIVTKQAIEGRTTYKSLQEIENISQYSYFIIASETIKHYQQLAYLDMHLKNKTIFCEKPLFASKRALEIVHNEVFVGYVLRFHPLLVKLKTLLQNETVINVNIKCGQYLPAWRPERDYRESYSAKKEEGGGVLLDLSHEIDYLQWLFGKMKEIKSYQVKISDLEIDSDDITLLIGKTDKNIMVSLSLDYISKISHRRVHVDTIESSYALDFITNRLIKKDRNGVEELYSIANLERNFMFEKMHQSILTDKKNICSFNEGLDVMDTIATIQGENR